MRPGGASDRRGSTDQRIRPGGVALVVVDCQTGFWSERMAADFPHFTMRVAALLVAARGAGVPVVHLREVFRADGADNLAPYRLQGRRLMVEGTRDVEVLPCAAELPGEPVLRKCAWDGFVGTRGGLIAALRTVGASVCLFCGLTTSVCVLQTATAAVGPARVQRCACCVRAARLSRRCGVTPLAVFRARPCAGQPRLPRRSRGGCMRRPCLCA